MKFAIRKASDWNYEDELEINSLEELIKFINNNGGKIILKEERITIYDDYVE